MSSKTRTLAIALSAVLILSVLGSGLAFAGTATTMTNHEDPGDECGADGDDVDADDANETEDANETYDANETDDSNSTDDGTDGDCETDDSNSTDVQPFGQVVTAYVHGLIDGSDDVNDSNSTNDTNVSDVPLGQQIAEFVVANNPGNAPDHAGPGGQPDHAGAGNETGKPAHAGGANETGQPDHAGQDGDEKRSGGPPEDKGNGK